jgi:hypothetical protein
MSQFPHDQFAKDLLEILLSAFGRVETDRKISSEVREIDVCFFPHPQPADLSATLGLLSRLACKGAAFEPFRNPVTPGEIRSCMSKLYDLHAELDRQQKRGGLRRSERWRSLLQSNVSPLPKLWILTPTLATATLESFGAITDLERWGEGVYLMPSGHQTGIVVIHQLPETEDTLWLRLLGKQQVQKRAIDEIHRLDATHPYRQNALELLSDLKVVLEAKSNRNNQEAELLMSLRTSPIYLEQFERATQKGLEQGLQQGLQQGLEQGRQQGKTSGERELVIKQLTRKVGALSPELMAKVNDLNLDRLEVLGEALLDFQNVGDLEIWLG